MLQVGLRMIPRMFIHLIETRPLFSFFLKKLDRSYGKNDPVWRLLLIATIIFTNRETNSAPRENSKAAANPNSLMNPSKKLLVPRNPPAIKLGNTKNFRWWTSSISFYSVTAWGIISAGSPTSSIYERYLCFLSSFSSKSTKFFSELIDRPTRWLIRDWDAVLLCFESDIKS